MSCVFIRLLKMRKDHLDSITTIGSPDFLIDCIWTHHLRIFHCGKNTKNLKRFILVIIQICIFREVFQYGQCHPVPSKSTDNAIGVIIILGIAGFITFIIVAAYFGNKRYNIYKREGSGSRSHHHHMRDYHKDDYRKGEGHEKENLRSKDEDKFSGGETGDGGGVAGGGF